MTIVPKSTVGELVAQNPARARVFEKYRIDYCCGGKIALTDACKRRAVSSEAVMAELAEVDAEGVDTSTNWTSRPMGELIDHIVESHHGYLRRELPRLSQLAARVSEVHGDRAPEVREVESVLREFRLELEEHMMKEEQVLFPWVKRLEELGPGGGGFPMSVENPIRCMEQEHVNAGGALERLRALTGGFVPPEDACGTWRVLYGTLAELEQDMHRHVHKEDSILFPRAMAAEKAVGAPA